MIIFGSLFVSLAAAIAVGVAAGTLIAKAIMMTINWLRNKIKAKLAKRNTQKVAVAELGKLVEKCENQASLADLEELCEQGCSHVIASVNTSGEVEDVELIEDTSKVIDQDVKTLINRTGEGMVVISA